MCNSTSSHFPRAVGKNRELLSAFYLMTLNRLFINQRVEKYGISLRKVKAALKSPLRLHSLMKSVSM